MDGNTIPPETVATTLAPNITNPSAVSFFGIDLNVIIPLMIIVSILAVFSCIIFSKSQQELVKYGGPVFAAVIALGGILFGGDDPYNLRIAIAAIGLLGYVVVYATTRFIVFLIGNIKNKTHTPNTESQLDIVLPIDYKYSIDKRFVEDLPANVADLIHVSEEVRILTNEFIDNFAGLTNDNARHNALKAYFLNICYHLASLFSRETRVHVRILKDSKYQKYISTYAHTSLVPDVESMKDMSLNNGMISESFTKNCSLIKLYNPTLHEEGSRNKWKNYLTFALPQITHGGKPVFTMGISVTRKINDRFVFLNYCAIETIIGRYIDSILFQQQRCGLSEFIERYYFPNNP